MKIEINPEPIKMHELFTFNFLSIEWNLMRLSDREPQKLTKTVYKTVLAGGMVTCGYGDLWYGDL